MKQASKREEDDIYIFPNTCIGKKEGLAGCRITRQYLAGCRISGRINPVLPTLNPALPNIRPNPCMKDIYIFTSPRISNSKIIKGAKSGGGRVQGFPPGYLGFCAPYNNTPFFNFSFKSDFLTRYICLPKIIPFDF